MLIYIMSALFFFVGVIVGIIMHKRYLSPSVELNKKYDNLSTVIDDHIDDFISLEEVKSSFLEKNYNILLSIHGMVVALKEDAQARKEKE